jgi:hypothetical protein
MLNWLPELKCDDPKCESGLMLFTLHPSLFTAKPNADGVPENRNGWKFADAARMGQWRM